VDKAEVNFKSFRSLRNAFDVNRGSLSEMTLSGSPNLLYRLSNSSCPVPSAVTVLLHGMKIAPLLSPWSTMTKIQYS
jgi:hypothetical protein